MNVLVLVHDGFEEVEMITPVDILRRAGHCVDICSMTGRPVLRGSHGIIISADKIFDENLPIESYDGVFLPGGLPNAHTLRDDPRVIAVVKYFASKGRLVAAICAAPCVLERAGLLNGKSATSYPGTIDEGSCKYTNDNVAIDGNIITSRGVGTAIDLGLAIIKYFDKCDDNADKLSAAIMYR